MKRGDIYITSLFYLVNMLLISMSIDMPEAAPCCLFRIAPNYETSMALETFCFGSAFGMVTVRMPSSTLAEIWSFTTSSGSV